VHGNLQHPAHRVVVVIIVVVFVLAVNSGRK
jgi:hypothetical protein